MKISHLAVYKDKNVSVYFLQHKYKGDTKNAKNNDKQKEMKEIKALYANATNNSHEHSPIYQKHRYENEPRQRIEYTSNFGAQYDSKRDSVACTCKSTRRPNEHKHHNGSLKQPIEYKYFGGSPKQIYTYRASKSFIDIGVGSVKALQRRKMRRVYLRETDDTGVGSSDLSSYCFPKKFPKAARDSYDSKRTSSKCVGGAHECINPGCLINQKLSPIIQTKSFATSPEVITTSKNTEIGLNTIEKTMETTGVQFETVEEMPKPDLYAKTIEPKVLAVEVKPDRIVSEQTTQLTNIEKPVESKKKAQQEKRGQKSCSSDSLLQHVHNLESPSKEKHSEASFRDPMENKLEKEYRKIFLTPKSKDSKSSYDTSVSAFKSASILRRRFEALKRGIVKKEDSVSKKTDSINMSIMSKQESLLSHRDASVASDPPSLVSRSYSSTKKYSPVEETVEPNRRQTSNYKREKNSTQLHNPSQSESQGVKGMFKLWGKKFNFEEDADGKRRASPMSSYNKTKKLSKEDKPSVQETNKKDRKFFFFKKKAKDKNKVGYKSKKNVTAGRCEVKEGLVLNIGGTVTPKVIAKISEETSEITRRTWLKRFLSSTIESAKSVNVRWNNNMFATSSSTVFELLDSVYKNTGVVIKSRSEITTEESSMYRSYTKNKVNFVRDIEAWMMPRTVLDKPLQPFKITSEKEKENNMQVSMSDQKWFIDKSEAFAHTIEVVLNSDNLKKLKEKASSECLKIDIPKDFFDTSSSDVSKRNHSSDEEVFKIVEYETNSEIRGRNAMNDLKKSYRAPNDVEVVITVKDSKNFQSQILETVIKRLPTGEVLVKGSNISSKRCDVIGVGIITQREMRDIRKPILKIQDDLTDYDSDPIPQLARKKCEFAESYLQEYYRNWTPLGIDLYSWCVSDSHLKSCSEKSLTSFHNQGDGSKSCPNIYEDFHTATIVASGEMSCNSPCAYEETCCNEKFGKLKKKFKKLPKAKTESELAERRIMPKDSLEVFKKRKLYAASGKSQWACFGGVDKLVSVPSIPSDCSRNSQVGVVKVEMAPACPPAPRYCKRVSMSPCDKPEGILTYKGAACDSCKKGKCVKHTKVIPTPTCHIPEPPCKPSCEKMKNPACNKPNVPSCHDVPKCPSNKSICPTSPLPPSCGPRLAPRCFPKDNQGKPPPCPATLPICKMPPTPECMLPSAPSCSACAKSSCSSNKKPCSPPPCSSPCKKPCSPQPPCARSPSAYESIMTWIKSSTSKCDSNTCPSTDRCCPHSPPGPCKNVKSPCESPNGSQKCSSGDSGYPLKRVKTPCGSGSSQNIQCAPQDPCFPDPPCGQKPPCPPQSSCPAQATCPKPPSPTCSPKSTCKKPTCPPKPTPPSCSPKPPCGSPKPTCGAPKPPCGSSKPSCGSPKTPCGSPKPPCDSPKPPCGSPKPPCGSPKPPCGSPNPPCGSPKPPCGSPSPPCVSPKPTCIPSSPCSSKTNCSPSPCPPKPPPTCERNPAALPKIHFPSDTPCSPRCTKSKISGIFLKMKPSGVKDCSPYCTSWDHTTTKLQGVKLTADENLCINIKNETPSTEEIRGCANQRNFKVADEDGRTLFERKDYTCGSQRNSMLGDLYRQSKINRVAAPIAVTNVSTDEDSKEPSVLKSDQNIGNLIEINFKLRITQGDKTTEVNIGNENDAKQNARTEIRKAHPEIYVVKNGQENATQDIPKNDINIKITVRNYKPTLAKIEHKRCSDEFSKKISEKFHTVSTGYSDLDENEDHVFSIHRATVNLSSSVDISNTPSKTTSHDQTSKVMSVEFDQNTSHTTEQIHTDITDNEIIEEKSETSQKDSVKIEQTKTDESILPNCNVNEHDDALIALSTSNEYNDKIMSKRASRENKKVLLKKVFQKASNQNKNKKTVRELRDMLKIILTDSSDNDDINENGNDLIKDVTYASLKPNYFRDTDSMNNYYQLESTLSSIKGSKTEAIYPAEDDKSHVSRSSDSDANDITFQGCMCSKVAEKLNEANIKVNCCCRENLKIDEETNCDLRNEEDFFLLNYKTAEYVDVETQNSKYVCSKINNLNVSLHKKHFEKTIEDITFVEKIDITPTLSKIVSPNHSTQDHQSKKDVTIPNNIIVMHNKELEPEINKDAKKVIDTNFGSEICNDILQSYEAKKAVLEIYAEKTEGDKYVAKLPKFVVEREHEIVNNYEKLSTNSYKSVCKKNIVMVSIRQK